MENDLRELYRLIFGTEAKLTQRNLTILARRLSEAGRVKKPWGWKYIDNILKGRQPIRPKVARAIEVLGAAYDSGRSPAVTGGREVVVWSFNGTQPYSIVMGHSQLCARVECGLWILTDNAHRRYCSPTCRRLERNRRRRAK